MQHTFKQYLIKVIINEAKAQSIRKSKFQELAAKLGVSYNELKLMPLKDINLILKYVGKHDFAPDSDFNKKELNMGIKVEMEHTDNKIIAKLIAKDHLKEVKDYYTRLKKMEMEANQNRERSDSDFI
jgi:hypothetical protein